MKQTRITRTVRPQRRPEAVPQDSLPARVAHDTSDAAALARRIDRLVSGR